jgi:hypothetical protein
MPTTAAAAHCALTAIAAAWRAAAGALAALNAKRDALSRRLEGLSKCRLEFQELSKCL